MSLNFLDDTALLISITKPNKDYQKTMNKNKRLAISVADILKFSLKN